MTTYTVYLRWYREKGELINEDGDKYDQMGWGIWEGEDKNEVYWDVLKDANKAVDSGMIEEDFEIEIEEAPIEERIERCPKCRSGCNWCLMLSS